jgi:hypothetical protein
MKSGVTKPTKRRAAERLAEPKIVKQKTINRKKTPRQTILLILVSLAVILAIFIIPEAGRRLGFWGECDAVQYFKQDPLANLSLSGLRLEHAEQTEDQRFMRKKSSPHVARWFTPANGQSYEEAFADLIDYAKQKEWVYLGDATNTDLVKEYGLNPETTWRGIKTNSHDYSMEITIKIIEPHEMDYSYDSPKRLIWVYLNDYPTSTVTINGEVIE